jgi:hypothetical protein
VASLPLAAAHQLLQTCHSGAQTLSWHRAQPCS